MRVEMGTVFSDHENTVTRTIYSVCIVLGLLVNAFIVRIYFKNKQRNTRFTRFLLHLSLLNIGQYVGILPYLCVDVRQITTTDPYLQSVLCGVTDGHGSMLVFSLASCILLTFMSILRCDAISNRFPRWMSDRNLNKLFIGIWVVGCVAFIPYLLSYRIERGYCVRQWIISDLFGSIYMVVLYTIGLIIPLATMSTTCVLSYMKLYSKNARGISIKRRRKQIVVLLCLLVVVYVLTWFPYSVYWLMTISTYRQPLVSVQKRRVQVLRYVLITSVLGGIVSPVMYAYKWRDFQRASKRCLQFCFSGIEMTESHVSSTTNELPSTQSFTKKSSKL